MPRRRLAITPDAWNDSPGVVSGHTWHWEDGPTLEELRNEYRCTNPQFNPLALERPDFPHWVRCRRCDHCLAVRRFQWVDRMRAEAGIWPRTWFVTLTYRNLDDYNYETVQAWLKRVRRRATQKLRYVCTTEHESKGGRAYNPHHHLLIYCGTSLTRREIEGPWHLGYTKAKLANDSSIRYVAKYLAKGTERIRASSRIGCGNPLIDEPPF